MYTQERRNVMNPNARIPRQENVMANLMLIPCLLFLFSPQTAHPNIEPTATMSVESGTYYLFSGTRSRERDEGSLNGTG
jgi:hypothetical protein